MDILLIAIQLFPWLLLLISYAFRSSVRHLLVRLSILVSLIMPILRVGTLNFSCSVNSTLINVLFKNKTFVMLVKM